MKMEFRWHKLMEVILDNTFGNFHPTRILVGQNIWAAIMEANNRLAYEHRAEITEKGGLVVSGVQILYSNYMLPYSMRVVMTDNAPYPEKVYGPEIWEVSEKPPAAVAEVKQIEYTENVDEGGDDGL